MLRLSRNSTLGKTEPCESAAPATNSAPDLSKVLRLPRNFNHWENLTLRKCCACHEICTSPCESAATATLFNPCETSALNEPAFRARPELAPSCSARAPNALRPGAANRLASSSSPETPIHARGHAFCRFLFFICLSESWLSISCRNTEVPSKLPLISLFALSGLFGLKLDEAAGSFLDPHLASSSYPPVD